MTTIAVLLVVICTMAIMVGVLFVRQTGPLLRDLGRHGRVWFEHPHDRALGEQPDEDAPDAPLPQRPLRGRDW